MSTASATSLPLIALKPADIPLGEPLPWAIVDRNGDSLLAAGDIVPGTAGRDWLFSSFAPHRAIVSDADIDATQAAPVPVTPAAPAAPAGETQYSLADLNLRPGDWLQIQLPPGAGSQRIRTRVIGHAPNHMLFITAPTGRSAPTTLHQAERLELWTFSGEDIFHFVCTVERVERAPFDYVVLSSPAQIRRKVLRRSQRVAAKIVASVTTSVSAGVAAAPATPDPATNSTASDATANVAANASSEASTSPAPADAAAQTPATPAADTPTAVAGSAPISAPGQYLVLLQDVSAEGVSMLADNPLGAPGDQVQLAFRVRVGDIDMPIDATGTIRGVLVNDDGAHLHGVELPSLAPANYVALKCYVYERLLALGNT